MEHVWTGICTILVALIEAGAAVGRKRDKKEKEEYAKHAALRAEESRLSMQMMSATLQLSVVTANALTGGHNNGNVAQAKDAAQKAMSDYTAFVRKVDCSEVAK